MMLAFLQNISAQCTAAGEGQYPASTVALNTNCTPKVVTSSAWTDEYSRLSGAGANTYVFTSSVATDFLTVTDEATNTVIAFGVTPLSYTFGAAPGDIRIYRHDNNTCPATSSTSRTITVTCTSCAGPGAPTCPTLTAPTNNATGVSTLPTLTWSAATNAVTYDVYIDADATCTITPTTLVATVATTSYTLSSSLAPSTSYRWMIVPKDCGGAAPASCTPFCFTTTVAPPANDNCTGTNGTPVALTPQSFATSCSSPVAATTVGATQSNTNCSATATNDDVWFSFTANATTETVRFEGVTAVTGTVTSMGMDTYTTCGGTNSNCNTGVTLTSGAGQANLTGLTIGTTYFLRVWTAGTSNSATFNICIIDPLPPPANDNPCGAIDLTVGSNGSCSMAQYTNANATSTSGPPAPGCSSFTGGDVWFKFTVPASGSVVLNSNVGVIIDGGMAIYSSSDNTCSGTFTLIECDDDDSPNGNMPFISRSGLTPGATIFVRFFEYGNDNNGTFDICATEPFNNNDCASATALSVSANLTCTTALTGQSTLYSNQSQTSCSGTADDDVWYSFVATTGSHIVTLSNVTGAPTMVTQVFSGTCGSLTSLICGTTYTTTVTGLTVGNTYYIRVHTSSGSGTYATSFDICVTTVTPPACTTNTAPTNGATGVSLTPTLTWATALGATSYDLYITPAPSGTWTNPLNVTTTSYTILAANILASNTTYSWYVVPKNTAGSATGCESNATTFTTLLATSNFSGTGNWSDAARWSAGIPVCGQPATIASGAVCTLDGTAEVSNLTVSGTLNLSGNLTLGCTSGGGNRTLTLNSGGVLNLSGGTTTVNGNVSIGSGSTFNQTGGDLIIDGNDGSSGGSVASGTNILSLANTANTMSGGTIKIVDPHFASTTTFSYNSSASLNASGTHTFWFGDGASTAPGGSTGGFLINTWVGSGRFAFNNLVLDAASGTNRHFSSSWSFGISGDLTINSGEFRPGVVHYVAGNLTNNGTYTSTSTLTLATFLSGSAAATTNAQTIGGSGVFRNLTSSPTANATSLTVNNTSTSGVAINLASFQVSGTLTLTAGKVTMNGGTGAMILGISTSTLGTLTGGSASSYIIGELRRWNGATSGNASRIFPIGSATNYQPITISFSSAQSTGGVISALFTASDPGTSGLPLTDGGLLCEAVSPSGYWTVERISGGGGTYTADANANGFTQIGGGAITLFSQLRLLKRPTSGSWTNSDGTPVAPTALTSVTRTGCTSFSQFALGGTFTALPLELTYFSGKALASSNMLTWETAIEKDVQWHIVERAADGVNFTEVGRTAGQLASSAPKKYELEDLRPIGKAYYRLRSVDLDGKESLSSVIVLERKGARFQIDNVFPSPTQGDLTVQFNAVEESTVNVMVYDFSGRLVLQQQLDAVKGFNQTTLQLGSLPAGMYNVTIVGTQSATEPVRIVKE